MGRKILVLDDDETFRKFVQLLLVAEKHTVLLASTVAGARTLIAGETAEEPLTLVIDVVLDRESGIEFAQEVAQRYPNYRVLLISGFTDDVLMTKPEDMQRIAFLRKPFVRGEIMEAINNLWE
jgi:two-component system cell cycle sensor histidine kinase/response regulator CckA